MKTIIGRSYPKGMPGESSAIILELDNDVTYFSNGRLHIYNTVTKEDKPSNATNI
jgi:hypothetical protein